MQISVSLRADYKHAWQDWEASDDAAAWDVTSSDGIPAESASDSGNCGNGMD